MKNKFPNYTRVMTRRSQRHEKGFTLIELLVVIGLISILAAGIGLSMRGGNPTSALRAGQGSLIALMSSARGQAALTQSDAMIVVDVTNAEQDECLRSLQVVVRAGAGLDQWRPVGDPVILPQGIYVVPPTGTSVAGVTLEGAWTPARKSKGFQSASALPIAERPRDPVNYPYYETEVFDNRTYLRFQAFSPLGSTSSDGTILLTTGRRTGVATISLDNPEMIRGVLVSRYGVPTLINEAATFDNVTIP